MGSYALEFFRRSFYCISWQRKKGGVGQTDINRDTDERENGRGGEGGGEGGEARGKGVERTHRDRHEGETDRQTDRQRDKEGK